MNKELKRGSEILIKATIIGRALDECPKEQRGYLIKTSRGKVYVNQDEILYAGGGDAIRH